jgi:ribose transport system substrate-binding protein
LTDIVTPSPDRPSIRSTRRRIAASALVFVFVLGGPAGAQSPSTPTVPTNPYADTGAIPGSGAGLVVGYIAGSDGDPFTEFVTQGVVEEAAIAGMELLTCDGDTLPRDPVACAQGLRLAFAQGVLNGQGDPDAAAPVCAGYGNLPTIAIDRSQAPCEVVIAGIDHRVAGRLAGEAVAAVLQAERRCAVDLVVTLDRPGTPGGPDRVEGLLEGFESECGQVPVETLRQITDASPGSQVEALLASMPSGGVAAILAADDPAALEALGVARAQDREQAVRIGAIGAEPAVWPEVSCDPAWVAETALFPERYGRTLIPAMVDLLNGQPVDPVLPTPLVVMNGETIRSFYPDIPAC